MASKLYLGGGDYLSRIDIQAESADVMSSLRTQIEELLSERHKVTDPRRPTSA